MKAAQVMFGYAGVLILCAVIAFVIAATRGPIQYTALIPVAMAAVVIVFGIMAGMYHKKHTVGMIGIHAGLALPLVYGLFFAYLAVRRFTAAEPTVYLATIFAVMAVASFVALSLLIAVRPKPEDRK